MPPKFFTREEYRDLKPKDKWATNCPFCFGTRDEDYVITETKYFSIFYNKFPVLWLENHLLVTPKRHIVFTSEMTSEESADLVEVEKFMKDFYKWSEYFSFIRQSNWWNARSIEHFHYHYLPWEVYNSFIADMLKHQWFEDKLWGSFCD